MNEKTLDDLVRKGLDERTPDLEALACLRIAAKQFSDAKPSASAIDPAKHAKLQEERDNVVRDLQAAKSDVERLRLILGKIMALRDAEQKIEKSKAEVEKEARDAINGKMQVPPARPVKMDPFSTWEADMFGGYKSPWDNRR